MPGGGEIFYRLFFDFFFFRLFGCGDGTGFGLRAGAVSMPPRGWNVTVVRV